MSMKKDLKVQNDRDISRGKKPQYMSPELPPKGKSKSRSISVNSRRQTMPNQVSRELTQKEESEGIETPAFEVSLDKLQEDSRT